MSGHTEKTYTVFQVAFNLFMACLISGVVIAAVFYFTDPIAAQKRIEMKNEAMQSLIAGSDSFEPIEGKKDWFVALKGKEKMGYIIPGEAKGFGGEILMLVGVSTDGKILDYTVLKHNETPGLGDLAGFSPFKDQFIGKGEENLEVVKDPTDKEHINALTGATITTNAVTKGIKEALVEAKEELKLR